MLDKANQYIKEKQGEVNQKYKPQYHFSAPIGWINDPNGFIQIEDELHLFYQHYPYDSVWGPMHWGHAKSTDGYHWEHLPIAIAPDQEYDQNGCFSGSSIIVDDELILMYTGHVEDETHRREVQAIAKSKDFINFEKIDANPVVAEEELNQNASTEDFRDPKVFIHEGVYYFVIASKNEEDRGQVLLFSSKDMMDWEFESVLLNANESQGFVWECPDLIQLEDKWVIVCSPMRFPEDGNKYSNVSSSVAFIGEMDWANKKFILETTQELDGGLDFYAPQTTMFNDKRVLIAWAQMWDRTMPTNELNHQWAGSMTLPRELYFDNGFLCQRPLSNGFNNKAKSEFSMNGEKIISIPIVESGMYELTFDNIDAENIHIKLYNEKESLLFHFDLNSKELMFNRENILNKIYNTDGTESYTRTLDLIDSDLTKVQLYIDKSVLEIFINDKQVMTNNFYSKNPLNLLDIETDKESSINISEYIN